MLSITALSHAPRRGLPSCMVDTNLPDSQVPADLQVGLSNVIACSLKKDLKASIFIQSYHIYGVPNYGSSKAIYQLSTWMYFGINFNVAMLRL